jgi:hypothetical protein
MAKSIFGLVHTLLDDSGALEPGGTIEVYDAGTTTQRTVYSDRALTTTAGYQITADAAGRFPERWIADSVIVKLVYKDSAGATLVTRDFANDDASNQADPINATAYGFKVGGGNSDATANTTALQAALDANYWVQLPEGTAYINTIVHTRSNRVTGAGQAATILIRANETNGRIFYASAKDDLIYEDMTLDGNHTNNTGDGGHGGIRLEAACQRWSLRRIKATGWRGTFSGSPVGAGMSSILGSHGRFDECWFDNCYDGYQLLGHSDARDNGSRLTANLRNGAVVDDSSGTGSDRYEYHGVNATGNSTTYAGAGLAIIDSADCKGYGGTFNSNTLGHGLQHNGADRCETHGGTFSSNGISGLDFFDSIDGKVFGGYAASNAIRGLEIDSASNGCVVTGFQGVSNVDVDISIFRSADVQLIGCEGNVRGWDAANIASATVSAGGTGYAVGNVLTIVGGTRNTAATLTVSTVSVGAVTGVTVSNAGDYWTFPTEPCAVTGGTGSGATFNFVATGEASSTCPRLQIIGGHRSDTLNFVTDACTEIRLTNVKATTITDASNEIVSAIGCDNIETIFALADVASYADQAAAATGITGVGRLFRFNTTGALGITLT